MITNRLLLRLTIFLLLGIAEPILISIFRQRIILYPPLSFTFSAILSATWVYIGMQLYRFFKDKHYIVVRHRYIAMKKIWKESMWVLLTYQVRQGNNPKLDFQFSEQLTAEGASHIVGTAAANIPNLHATLAADQLMRDQNINPENN